MARKVGRKKGKKTQQRHRAAALRSDTIPRAVLGRELQRQIESFGLSRRLTAVAVREAETQVTRLMTGHFEEFSADRLARMLVRLGSDVTITIRHRPRLGRGRMRMEVVRAS